MLSMSLKGVIAQTLLKRSDGKGRVAALEIMVVNHAISASIREGKSHVLTNAIQTGRGLGMQLLNDALLQLVKAGAVGPSEAHAKSMDKIDMANKLRSVGHGQAAAL